MEIVELADSTAETTKEMFLEHIRKDPYNHYFFILDWYHHQENTRFYMAMDGKMIRAVMILYNNRIVQLRGDREGIKAFLDAFDLEDHELLLPMEHKDLALERYTAPLIKEIMLMRLDRGQEDLQMREEPRSLSSLDAEEVWELLKGTEEELWDDLDKAEIEGMMQEWTWVGIKVDGKIVSVASTWLLDIPSNIFIVATREDQRSKGYASSLVSFLVQRIFERSKTALIHVFPTNTPAVRAYSKVGFRPFKRYLILRMTKSISRT